MIDGSEQSRDRPGGYRPSSPTEAALVVSFFSLLAIAYTFPLVRELRTHIVGDAGDPLLVAWILGWDADRIRHGFSGIWDAPNFFPYRHTLLYSEHFLGVSLFTVPLQWLSGNAIFVYNVAFLASFVATACGTYILARWLTGRRDAAFVAALIFVCQPFRASHSSHLQLLSMGWLPLSLWSLHRYFRTERLGDLLACAAFYLLQALTTGYFAYYGLLPLALIAAYELWSTRSFSPRLLAHGALAALVVAVVMLPVIRGYADLRRESGLRRPIDEITNQSAEVGDYVSASPSLYIWRGIGNGRGEHELFPGLVAVVLALGSISLARQRRYRGVIALYGAMLFAAFVLSLGPSPRIFGHVFESSSPYAVLLRLIPGLEGIRVPARLAVVVQLALAILAAFGSIRLFDIARPRSEALCVAVVAVLTLAIAAEGLSRLESPPFDYRGNARDRDAYAYLTSLPKGGVIELPTMAEHLLDEFEYQYMTLVHGHRVVNGHSGYVTPLALWLRGGHSPLRESGRQRDAVEMLRSIGVRYLVIHRSRYADSSLLDELLRVVEHDPSVIAHRSFEDATVAVLTPFVAERTVSPGAPIASTSITARASDSQDRLPFLFDGDADSRWLTGKPQFGDEWLELELDRVRDVQEVRLQLGTRSFGDYPRELVVEADEGGTTRTLFQGSILAQLAHGIMPDGQYPWIEIALPPNATKTLRLRQVGRAHTFFWSIHELRLFERK